MPSLQRHQDDDSDHQPDSELLVEGPAMKKFYQGKSMLLTGVTGFLGKVILEQTLRTVPGIDKIYVIIREKKGLTGQERLAKIFQLPLFEKLLEMYPDALNKVHVVGADITEPDLGLRAEDRAAICRDVNLVIHGAASVKFDDPLPFAVRTNTISTRNILELCLDITNLLSFIYFSTAYTQCDRYHIEEKMYPPPADWRDTFQLIDQMDEKTLNIMTAKYMNHLPNTYVFSKSLAEHMVKDYSDRIPCFILRPSIVISTLKDPIPGWIDNLNGPVALIGGYAIGVVRTSLVNLNITPDFMPVDLVALTAIYASRIRALMQDKRKLKVLHCSSKHRSITIDAVQKLCRDLREKLAMPLMIWYPSDHVSTSKFFFVINTYVKHLLPALVIDLALRISGRRPRLWKIQTKVYRAMMALSHFTMNDFKIDNYNIFDLNSNMLEEDKTEFYRDPDDYDPYIFLQKSAVGFLKYMLKQTDEDNERATNRSYWFGKVDMVLRITLQLFTAYILLFYFNFPMRILSYVGTFFASTYADLTGNY